MIRLENILPQFVWRTIKSIHLDYGPSNMSNYIFIRFSYKYRTRYLLVCLCIDGYLLRLYIIRTSKRKNPTISMPEWISFNATWKRRRGHNIFAKRKCWFMPQIHVRNINHRFCPPFNFDEGCTAYIVHGCAMCIHAFVRDAPTYDVTYGSKQKDCVYLLHLMHI